MMTQENIERQLEEVEVLEAIFPDELTIDASSVSTVKQVFRDNPGGLSDEDIVDCDLPILSLTIKLGRIARLEHSTKLSYAHPYITIQFPTKYPDSSPPLVTNCVGFCAVLNNVVTKSLEEHSGEECTMQLIMSINERIDELNERTAQEHQKVVEANEQRAKAGIKAAQQKEDPNAIPVLGQRIINSPYILKPAKIKDIKKCADELNLGGYAKVGKPGIIVIEGPEESCKQYCPMLENRGWKYQKIQGEQRKEGVAGGSIDEMRLLNAAGEFRVLGEDSMSELSQLCRHAGLGDLFFASLNIHNSKRDDDKATKGVSRKKREKP